MWGPAPAYCWLWDTGLEGSKWPAPCRQMGLWRGGAHVLSLAECALPCLYNRSRVLKEQHWKFLEALGFRSRNQRKTLTARPKGLDLKPWEAPWTQSPRTQSWAYLQ